MSAVTKEQTAKNLLKFIKDYIRENKVPYVSWRTIVKNSAKIVREPRRPDAEIWSVMVDITYTLIKEERGPHAKNPLLYEIKVGNSWVYYPVEMIEKYTESDEM